MSLILEPKKEFKFTMISNDGDCSVAIDLPLDCSWYEIVPYFNQFLAGCGYIPKQYNEFVGEIDVD